MRHMRRHSTRAQVEQGVLVEMAHCCAVGALDVVGEDFEARPGVDFGVVREEQVLVRLAGVGAERVRSDDDVSVEHAVSVFVHHTLVELAAGARGAACSTRTGSSLCWCPGACTGRRG